MPDTTQASAEYKVNLDNYYGPLDLLLHLVKETEVDITAITLARACEQYISFLTAMEKLDLSLSGNFLALASQLLLIKSRTIAPPELLAEGDGTDEDEEEDVDSSLELIKKLLDYKRFKDRSRALDRLGAERALRFSRPRIRIEGETEVEPLRNLELWDLVLLYSKAMKGVRLEAMLSILYRDVPLEVFIHKIQNALREKRRTTLSELLGETPDRTAVLGTFLGLLQLAKMQEVRIEQDVDMGEIQVEAVPESERPVEAPPLPDMSGMEALQNAPAAAPVAPPHGTGAYAYSVIDDPNAPPVPLSERADAKAAEKKPEDGSLKPEA
ncbi:MAG TPA: segregation/condensation protein A [Planctomycetota bacterium]|nr:segregation/condensation protein A [Planctomycetota bacterium]